MEFEQGTTTYTGVWRPISRPYTYRVPKWTSSKGCCELLVCRAHINVYVGDDISSSISPQFKINMPEGMEGFVAKILMDKLCSVPDKLAPARLAVMNCMRRLSEDITEYFDGPGSPMRMYFISRENIRRYADSHGV